MESYVYVYLDPRKPGKYIFEDLHFEHEPFYVGKGYGIRAYDHMSEKKIYNKFKTGKIRKILNEGLEPYIVFLYENLTDDEAQSKEIEVISKIGRSDKKIGPLTNLTDGGDGSRGYVRKEESSIKHKETLKANTAWLEKVKSPEFAKKSSERMKAYFCNEENRKNMSMQQLGEKNSMYGKKGSDKQKEAVRLAHKEGRIKLSEKGRLAIIESNKRKKGKKLNVLRSDINIYILTLPDGSFFKLNGNKELSLFCKNRKLQYHVLKNNINKLIDETLIIGSRIAAKNTLGCKLIKTQKDNTDFMG
jgi:hypothetical protein